MESNISENFIRFLNNQFEKQKNKNMFHGITRLKNHNSFFFRSVECLSENLNNSKKNLELIKTAVGRPIPNKDKSIKSFSNRI